MTEGEEIVREMIRVSKEGLCIGVLFNDPELNELRAKHQRAREKATRESEQLAIPWTWDDSEINRREFRNNYVNRQTSRDLIKVVDREIELKRPVEKDFEDFLREQKLEGQDVGGYTSEPKGSRFDLTIHISPVPSASLYLKHAREKFLSYSFMTSEAFSSDPIENLLGHCEMVHPPNK